MMLNIGFAVTLETTTGFTLNTDQLDSAVLGYLETAVNASIRSADWSRGRDSMLDNFSAGSCRIVLDNRDRLLDPANTSSALYGELYPGRRLTLYMTQSKVREPVFSGYVDSWTYDYTLSGDATVTVNVLDAFSYLAQQQITSISAPEELSGARVNRVLSYIGWPLGKRAIDTGYSTLAAETISNVSVLDYLTKVAQSEFGMFYADRFGILQFRQRNRINTFSDLRVRNIPGDDSSYVEDIEFDYSFDRVFNSVTLTNQNTAVTASASNSASVAKYGQRPDEFDVLISNVTQMQSLATGIVNLYGVPDFIARRATINLNTVALVVTSIQNKDIIVRQYTVDVGYLTSVYWIPPGSVGGADPITDEALMITGVKYSATPGSIYVTLELDYALGYDALILDDIFKGLLDTGKLGV